MAIIPKPAAASRQHGSVFIFMVFCLLCWLCASSFCLFVVADGRGGGVARR
jgi:hypothetical protein